MIYVEKKTKQKHLCSEWEACVKQEADSIPFLRCLEYCLIATLLILDSVTLAPYVCQQTMCLDPLLKQNTKFVFTVLMTSIYLLYL